MSDSAKGVGTASEDPCLQYLAAMAQLQHVPSIFLLKLGRSWAAQRLPRGVARGPQRQCYENAGRLALQQPGFTYVEGYAYPSGLIPVAHAWCVDERGYVVDNTLAEPGSTVYFGVAFSRALLIEVVTTTKHWGLFGDYLTAEMLDRYLDDVMAGAWPVGDDAVSEIRALLHPYRAAAVSGRGLP